MKKRIAENYTEAKLGSLEMACQRYSIGRTAMRELAQRANAVVRLGKSYRINFSVVDDFIDSITE